MSDLDALNPFVVLRARARNEKGIHVSQAELAELAGVSEQYIRRQETGLINQPSARVSEALNSLIYPETALVRILRENIADIIMLTEVRPPELELITIDSAYAHWVAARRAVLKRTFQYKDFSHEQNVAQLVNRVTISAGLMPSVYAFCKLLAIHVYAVQSALADSKATGHLADALSEAGIRWKRD